MTDHHFMAAMRIGIPPLPAPAAPPSEAILTGNADIATNHPSAVGARQETVVEKIQYSWSTDEERFHGPFDSIGAALADAFDTDDEAAGAYVGENRDVTLRSLFTARDVVEGIQERLMDRVGEASDDFLASATQEQLEELDAFLGAWVTKVDNTTFWDIRRSAWHDFADHGLIREGE